MPSINNHIGLKIQAKNLKYNKLTIQIDTFTNHIILLCNL